MGNMQDLTPAPANPELRMALRLAALEQRIAALESHRDILITPIDVSVDGVTPTVNLTYNWKGGRLWIIWGGSGSQQSGAAGGVRATMTFGSFTVDDLISYSETSSAVVGLGTVATEIPASGVVLGNNTVSISRVGTAQIDVSGLIIEWPQA
jgi:hypothetical protein